MKTKTIIAAIGLALALPVLDAAAKPGRPEALTRGLGVNPAGPAHAVVAERVDVNIGRLKALTRGLGSGETAHSTSIANGLSPEQKPGRPEYHTRGIYCSHRGKRS